MSFFSFKIEKVRSSIFALGACLLWSLFFCCCCLKKKRPDDQPWPVAERRALDHESQKGYDTVEGSWMPLKLPGNFFATKKEAKISQQQMPAA